MAIKFLSGQTISGTLTVSGNVQGATFNGLAINTTGTNNVANQIVRTEANGYANFGWINSVSGNHPGSITRITASNDAYLRYVTPAQFRTGVTDGFYAPSSTVTGVTSVATGNGLTGGTITSTGTLSMSGSYTGTFAATDTIQGYGLTSQNKRGNSGKVPQGHYAGGETVWEMDNTWSSQQLADYFNASVSNVYWTEVADAPGGNCIYINGGVSVGGVYNSGFPYLPVETNSQQQADYYMEVWIQNVGTNQTHYMGSNEFNESFGSLGGNPGSYGYWVMANSNPGTSWTKYSAYIGGFSSSTVGMFELGTKYWTPQALFNYGAGSGTRACRISGWKVIKVQQPGKRSFDGVISATGGNSTQWNSAYANQGNYLPLAGGTMAGSIAMSNNTLTGVGNVTLNNGFVLGQGGSNYATFNSWVYLASNTGLYAPANGAHFYPNNSATYGAWRIDGSRNGWNGITFYTGSNHMELMSNGSTMGMYNGVDNEWMVECQRNSYTRLYYNGIEQGRTDNGFFLANNQLRSPIFYDSNNTAYYLDPASDTSINTKGAWRCANSTWDGEFTGKIQYHGSYWYMQTTNGVLVRNASGANNITLNSTGVGIAANDWRAPQFYDSADTGYYLDPNGKSNLYSIKLNGFLTGSSTGCAEIGRNHAYNTMELKGYGAEFMIGSQSTDIHINYRTCNNGATNNTPLNWFWRAGSPTNWSNHRFGTIYAASSAQAPVFYDSVNTAFYGDFASTTTSLSTAGKWVCQGGHGSARMQLNYQHSATDSGNSGTLTGWVSEPGITYNSAGIGGNINVSGQYYGRQYNSGYGCYVRFDKNNGNVEHWMTTATAGNAGGQGTRLWYNDNSGNAFASLSSRSPTFYDLNDTNYYLNPNSTSQLNVLNCAGTLTVTGSGGVVASKFTDYNNGSFYLDPSSTGTSVNVAGDVVAYASSDIRFKNNITPITNALDKLSKIGGYTFEWNEISHKETGKKDIGVVAQEVEEILPEIVETRSNGYKAVDYQKLTALLIESVKEQQFIIDDLKARIETLENN